MRDLPVTVLLVLGVACNRPAPAQAPSASPPAADDSADVDDRAEPFPSAAEPPARAAKDACDQGQGSACLALGVSYANGTLGLPQDRVRAARFPPRQVNNPDRRAQSPDFVATIPESRIPDSGRLGLHFLGGSSQPQPQPSKNGALPCSQIGLHELALRGALGHIVAVRILVVARRTALALVVEALLSPLLPASLRIGSSKLQALP